MTDLTVDTAEFVGLKGKVLLITGNLRACHWQNELLLKSRWQVVPRASVWQLHNFLHPRGNFEPFQGDIR